ncbi:MAG: neutral zinc metallopeptidase [Pseudomonadota bacterium]|nr:neutral zinc metallopeptidase [Pseudomonadota bacterium]
MRWKQSRRSSNIEDRRGTRMKKGLLSGGLGTIAFLLIAHFFGYGPAMLFKAGTSLLPAREVSSGPRPAAENEQAEMVATVLADTEDVWTEQFRRMGLRYEQPTLVLFTGMTESACGLAQEAMGPFYCPGDRKVYVDLQFYDDMKRQFGASGDFAQAYVVAHEVGHHVQTLLGISDQVEKLRRRAGKREGNRIQVRMELQADCYAGVWANHTQHNRQFLEKGDIEEGLNAAAAIGDDRLQRQTQGRVVPDAFTHGTSEQRVKWFYIGMKSGDMNQCDTFSTRDL